MIQDEYIEDTAGSSKDFVMKHIHRLQDENPQILDFMSRYALSPGDGPLAHMTGMVLLYRLLEAQAAADTIKI